MVPSVILDLLRQFLRYCDFLFLRWRRTGAKTHHHAKFRQNRSICCGDMAIIRFFKMAAVRHLGFARGTFEQPRRALICGLYHCAKFDCDPCSNFYCMKVLIFRAFRFKMLIHTPKSFLLRFDPLYR